MKILSYSFLHINMWWLFCEAMKKILILNFGGIKIEKVTFKIKIKPKNAPLLLA
jgi:hypothetical protein